MDQETEPLRAEARKVIEDLEPLRRRLEEFRRTRAKRGALPDQLWQEAAEAARRHGVNFKVGPIVKTIFRLQ